MRRAHQRVGVAVAFMKPRRVRLACSVPVGPRRPLGVQALHGRVHDVAAHDRALATRGEADREVVRRVAGRGLEPDLVVEGIVARDQLRLPGRDHRQHAVLEREARELGVAQLPRLELLPGEYVAGVGEGRHPAAVHQPGVPADVVAVHVGAHDEVDVLQGHAERMQRLHIGIVGLHVPGGAVRRCLWLPTQESIRIV